LLAGNLPVSFAKATHGAEFVHLAFTNGLTTRAMTRAIRQPFPQRRDDVTEKRPLQNCSKLEARHFASELHL
jgi:hypothetical protein